MAVFREAHPIAPLSNFQLQSVKECFPYGSNKSLKIGARTPERGGG